MTNYLGFIEQAHLVRDVSSTVTTGDLEYPGTALEIEDSEDGELFHVVVDSKGEQQVLFFSHDANYRIPVRLLERILLMARDTVQKVDE